MLKKIPYGLVILASFILLTSCSTMQPVMNVKQPIAHGMSTKHIESAITQGAHSLGWKTHKVRTGLIVATINSRGHYAAVNIKYNRNNYCITYKSSRNLNYNGALIHKHYNSWIKNLNDRIQRYL